MLALFTTNFYALIFLHDANKTIPPTGELQSRSYRIEKSTFTRTLAKATSVVSVEEQCYSQAIPKTKTKLPSGLRPIPMAVTISAACFPCDVAIFGGTNNSTYLHPDHECFASMLCKWTMLLYIRSYTIILDANLNFEKFEEERRTMWKTGFYIL